MIRTLADTLEKKRGQARHLPTHRARLRPRHCSRRWPTREQRFRPTTFCETVAHVEAVVLLNTMHYSLAEMKTETPVCTLPDVNAKALANTMVNRLVSVKAVKVGELVTLVATLTEVHTKTAGKTLQDL